MCKRFLLFIWCFFFLFGYLKKSVGDGAIKMHLKNVRVQTGSRVRADTMCLAQPVVPLHSKSLSVEKSCSNAMMQKESYRWCSSFLLELTSVIIKIEGKKICLVNLPILPLQYYHPVLFLPFTLGQGDSGNPNLQFHKFVFCWCWRHLYLVFV